MIHVIRLLKRLVFACLPNSGRAWLRTLRFRYTAAKFERRIVTHDYGGQALRIELADPLSQGWYDHDWPALPEIVKLQESGMSGARIFDLGAHQCVVAAMLARAVGPAGEVVAVEAIEHDATAGRRNLELNGIRNCKVVHGAAGSEPGKMRWSNDMSVKEIKVYSVDELTSLYGAPDALFVDIEGWECKALKGAQKTLALEPHCFVEIHSGVGLETAGGSVEQVISYFPPSRFELHIREEDDERFRDLQGKSWPQGRFFLLALAKSRLSRSLKIAA